MTKRWEYKRFVVMDTAETDSEMNKLGADGWELVSAGFHAFNHGGSWWYCMFKRPNEVLLP